MADKQELLNLQIICNTCGKPMRLLGEWPTQFPRDENGNKNVVQCARYMCESCRFPHPEIAKGMPVGIAVLL